MIICLTAFSCAPSKEKEWIRQSVAIHDSAMAIGKGVGQKIKQMNSFPDTLKEDMLKDSLASLKQDFSEWEQSIVEVPGHDAHHHDHQGHDHGHHPAPDLTPEMILDIQKDLNTRVKQLDQRAQLLLEALEDTLE